MFHHYTVTQASDLTAGEADNTRRQHSPVAAKQVAAVMLPAVALPLVVGTPPAVAPTGVQPLPVDVATANAAVVVVVAEHKRSRMAGSRRRASRIRVPGRAEDWSARRTAVAAVDVDTAVAVVVAAALAVLAALVALSIPRPRRAGPTAAHRTPFCSSFSSWAPRSSRAPSPSPPW